MAVLEGVAAAEPSFRYSLSDMQAVADRWLGQHPAECQLFKRVLSSSGIRTRCFAIPLEQVLSLNGMARRAQLFHDAAVALGTAAAQKALADNRVAPEEIESVIFTSCSVPSIPCVDIPIIERLGLKHSVRRVPMFQHGCGGAAVALGMAEQFAPRGKVLVLSVEICSLVYQKDDLSGGNLVGSALFADGSGAAIISAAEQGAAAFVAQRSVLLPASFDLMGYRLQDDGIHLFLEKELPACVARHAPPAITAFLAEQRLLPADIPWWLIHPGGVRVLQAFEGSLGLSREQLQWSWQILGEQGNMSSASILFVLERFLRSGAFRPGDKALIVGLGPGLSLELILLRRGAA